MLRGHETTPPGFTRCLLSPDQQTRAHKDTAEGRRSRGVRRALRDSPSPVPGHGEGGRGGLRSGAGAPGGGSAARGERWLRRTLKAAGSCGLPFPLRPPAPPDPAAQPPAEGVTERRGVGRRGMQEVSFPEVLHQQRAGAS